MPTDEKETTTKELTNVEILIDRLHEEAIVEIDRRLPYDQRTHQGLYSKNYNRYLPATKFLVCHIKNSGCPGESGAQKDAKADPLRNIIKCIEVMNAIEDKMKKSPISSTDPIIAKLSKELSNVEDAPFHHKHWYKIVSLIKELAKKCGIHAEWTQHKPYSGPMKSEFWETERHTVKPPPVPATVPEDQVNQDNKAAANPA